MKQAAVDIRQVPLHENGIKQITCSNNNIIIKVLCVTALVIAYTQMLHANNNYIVCFIKV